MAKIKLTPSTLQGQAGEMQTLKGQYETLFQSTESLLQEINYNWSANLANNFSGKITAAQNGFRAVTDMLQIGVTAATSSVQKLSSVDSELAGLIQGVDGESTAFNAAGALAAGLAGISNNEEGLDPEDIEDGLGYLKDLFGAAGEAYDDDDYGVIGSLFGMMKSAFGLGGATAEGDVTGEDVLDFIKSILKTGGKLSQNKKLSLVGEITNAVKDEWSAIKTGDVGSFLQNSAGVVESAGDVGMVVGELMNLATQGAQSALTAVTTIGTMTTRLVGDIIKYGEDGFTVQEVADTVLEVGTQGGATLVKGLTLGLLDIDVDGAVSTYKNNATAVADFLADTGLPLGAQCALDVVASPVIAGVSTLQIVGETIAKPFELLEKGFNWAADGVVNSMSK